MKKWKPIKTAPRDGSPVLLFLGEGHYQVGYWSKSDPRDDTGSWLYRDRTWKYILHGKPTHWMPLPPPPGLVIES